MLSGPFRFSAKPKAAPQVQLHGAPATPNRKRSPPKKAASIQVVAEYNNVAGSLGTFEIAGQIFPQNPAVPGLRKTKSVYPKLNR